MTLGEQIEALRKNIGDQPPPTRKQVQDAIHQSFRVLLDHYCPKPPRLTTSRRLAFEALMYERILQEEQQAILKRR